MTLSTYKHEYSDAEIRMFEAILPILKEIGLDRSPTSMYSTCVHYVFLNKLEGPHVEALRRAYTAFCNCTHDRRTPEFDKLCEF